MSFRHPQLQGNPHADRRAVRNFMQQHAFTDPLPADAQLCFPFQLTPDTFCYTEHVDNSFLLHMRRVTRVGGEVRPSMQGIALNPHQMRLFFEMLPSIAEAYCDFLISTNAPMPDELIRGINAAMAMLITYDQSLESDDEDGEEPPPKRSQVPEPEEDDSLGEFVVPD